jgi:N6-adenosine-specific RNA methylase IME4
MLGQLHARVFESGPFAGLPREHFRVALIDPPWSFRTWSAKGKSKSADRHYACQTLENIIALPVSQLMADDAVMFLWVIQSHLPQGLRVIEAWNFTFKTVGFIWIKPRLGMGFHTRAGAELCLLATRGKGYQRQDKGVRQVVLADVREHSRKPDEVIHRIDRLVGDVPRIELFAREQTPGWSVWGDQVQLNLFAGVRPNG